ncbi:MAG TPA: hypothetical protein VHR47_13305 [Bacillota bacterium]|nr:hypothetical protein [Bacillota bacterium]
MRRKKRLMLSVFIIILAVISVGLRFLPNAEADSIWGLDFGQNQPNERLRVQQNIVLDNETAADGWKIAWREPLRCRNGEIQEIPRERLKLSVHNDAIPITDDAVIIETPKSSKRAQFLFVLELDPSDRPGHYEGVLVFTPRQGSMSSAKWGDPIQLRVLVQVEPWLKAEINSTTVELDNIPRSDPKRLYSSVPVTFKIATNDRWNFLIKIVPDDESVQGLSLDVKVDGSTKYLSSVSSQINPGDKWSKVIAGLPTTIDGFTWAEFSLNFAIPDYRRYKAGRQRFNLSFQVETVSN